jgi:hypothetical protein
VDWATWGPSRRFVLVRLGKVAGGLDYTAAGQAQSHYGKRLEKETKLRSELRQIESHGESAAAKAERVIFEAETQGLAKGCFSTVRCQL